MHCTQYISPQHELSEFNNRGLPVLSNQSLKLQMSDIAVTDDQAVGVELTEVRNPVITSATLGDGDNGSSDASKVERPISKGLTLQSWIRGFTRGFARFSDALRIPATWTKARSTKKMLTLIRCLPCRSRRAIYSNSTLQLLTRPF